MGLHALDRFGTVSRVFLWFWVATAITLTAIDPLQLTKGLMEGGTRAGNALIIAFTGYAALSLPVPLIGVLLEIFMRIRGGEPECGY